MNAYPLKRAPLVRISTIGHFNVGVEAPAMSLSFSGTSECEILKIACGAHIPQLVRGSQPLLEHLCLGSKASLFKNIAQLPLLVIFHDFSRLRQPSNFSQKQPLFLLKPNKYVLFDE